MVGDDVPVVVRKAAEKAVKEATEYEKEKVSKSTFSQRVSPFLWGFVLASFAGIYFLNKDLRESNMHLQDAIISLHMDRCNDIKLMEERIEELEKKSAI